MENGIGVFCAPLQELHCFFRWEDDQFNIAPLSLTSNLIHDWQCSGARADHQATSFPPPFSPPASFFPEAGRPQLLEEFALGLLHTLGGFGIADRRGDAL
jgi:hypothetical protein